MLSRRSFLSFVAAVPVLGRLVPRCDCADIPPAVTSVEISGEGYCGWGSGEHGYTSYEFMTPELIAYQEPPHA